MAHIPWYRSPVFTIGLSAFVGQLLTMIDEEFVVKLLSGEPRAIARGICAILSAAVVGFRAASTVQPLTLGKPRQDQTDERIGGEF